MDISEGKDFPELNDEQIFHIMLHLHTPENLIYYSPREILRQTLIWSESEFSVMMWGAQI